MWNFSYVIPTLLVLVIFMGYYFGLPRIPIRINHTFIMIVVVEFLVLTTDIVATWACINYATLPVGLLYLLNGAYFIAFFLRAYSFFYFTVNVLKSSFSYNQTRRVLVLVPFCVFSLVVITSVWTHLFFYIDETGYHSGVLYNTLYLLIAFYSACSFYLITRHKSRVRRKRELNSVVWYNLILVLGAIVRYVFPTYLLMDTFCLMSLIIIYLSYENPDFYLEPRTWIFNSRALREYVEEINNKKNYTVLMFVIHNYNDLRDLYGIRQMDQGICLIGDYLRKHFKDEMVFYYGNGRFALLGKEDFDYETSYKNIRERFDSSWKADDAELFLEVGGAVLKMSENKLAIENVMSILSEGFDLAGKSDEDRVIIVDKEIQDRIIGQTEIKKTLNNAIEHDQLKVYLQPIVNSATGKLEGAEALSRIFEDSGKMISPALFVPIAEKNGMINQVGDQVFEQVCSFVKENNVKAMGLSWINVNLSPIQFMRSDIAEKFYSCAKKYGVDPDFIHLEITEEALIDDSLLVKQMQALSSKGFHFVLDDYGKGYSNITRLRNCPFINVKLDMSLVWDYCKKPDEILPNMVNTFGKMGFSITAEGIENQQMAELMADMGVTHLQGYHFSKPVSMKDFVNDYAKE